MKKYFLLALCALLFFVVGCAGEDAATTAPEDTPEEEAGDATAEATPEQEPEEAPEQPSSPDSTDVPDIITGRIEMEDGGVISFELYPEIAPQSVLNFVYLARQGFYDGLVFHRIIHGFMIQGGCPDGIGNGNPGYSIVGEFANNGIPNNISHVPGVLSMARSAAYNSAGSQFFIVHGDATFLDNEYAGFGRVTDGMDIVDMLAETPNDGQNGSVAAGDRPVMRTIVIDYEGDLPEPDKLGN